jgi:hypothetical protein
MRIVKFANGKYAIEKGLFFKRYKDLSNEPYWWPKTSIFFLDCVCDDINTLTSIYHGFDVVERISL